MRLFWGPFSLFTEARPLILRLRPYAVHRMPLARRAAHREMQRQSRLPQPRPLERLERLNEVEMHGACFTRAVAGGKVKGKK